MTCNPEALISGLSTEIFGGGGLNCPKFSKLGVDASLLQFWPLFVKMWEWVQIFYRRVKWSFWKVGVPHFPTRWKALYLRSLTK